MKKAVVLVVVLGTMIVIFTLAIAALFLMTQESNITEHKIRRIRALYAAKAGAVHALDMLKDNQTPGNITIGSDYNTYGYPRNVTIDVYREITGSGSILDGVRPVNVTVDYEILSD